MKLVALACAAVVALHVPSAIAAPLAMVACSPGSPGTTADAQPAMDALAAAVAGKAGVPLAATYEQTEAGGVKRLGDAAIAVVSLPFYLAHGKALGLHARLMAVGHARPALEQWTLVAKHGAVASAAALDGFTIVGNTAWAPAFVRGVIAGSLGALPASVKLSQSTAVLSALRKAAAGDKIAVALDGVQQASLATLPFGKELDVVAKSPAAPVAIVATIDAKLDDKAWAPIATAFAGLASDGKGKAALDGIQLDKFTAIDDKALAAAQKLFEAAAQ